MKLLSLFILLLAYTTTGFAQLKDYSIVLDGRYDRIDNTDENLQSRLQDRIRMGFTFDAFGKFELVGLAETGPAYGNAWGMIHDFNDETNTEQKLYFRRLYIEKSFKNTTIQAGSLEGIDSIGIANTPSSGWIDGISAKIKSGNADIKVVVGSLYDSNNPDVFSRKRKLNFAEIEISKKLFEELLVEAGYERFEDDFLKGKMTLDLSKLGAPMVKLFANVLYDIQENVSNYDIGASIDVLEIFNSSYKNYLKLDVFVSHLDPGMNFRNSLYTAYFQDGTNLVVRLSGKIDKKGRFKWSLRNMYGKNGNRFDAGISIRLGK